jgi:hypothetical protein
MILKAASAIMKVFSKASSTYLIRFPKANANRLKNFWNIVQAGGFQKSFHVVLCGFRKSIHDNNCGFWENQQN